MSASAALERIDFDFSNPDDSQNIGVFLRAGTDGDQLSSTLTGGKEALDVNIAGTDVEFTVNIESDNLNADDAIDDENPLKVGSHVNTGASVLPAISADGDKADMISDLYRRVWTTSAPNVGWSSEGLTTSATPDTAEQADSTKQAGRQYIMFQNIDNESIFIGPSGVTRTGAARGYEVAKGTSVFMDFGEALDLYTVASSASQNFVLTQVG